MSKVMGAVTDGGRHRMRVVGALVAAVLAAGLVPWVSADTARPSGGGHGHGHDRGDDDFLFFAADGLTQNFVRKYADQGVVPGFRNMLRNGARASGNGLLTQSPPNTGAGWFTLTTGAWPAVHGSTNNTFHINGQAFFGSPPPRTAAFDPGVLQAETLAQAAERGGKKVAQIEWAGGRSGAIDGPTIDFRQFVSGRGVTTNYIAPADDAAFTASFGLQFDHPGGFAGRPAFPQAAPSPATGWTDVPRSFSPPRWRCACGCSTARTHVSTGTASTPTSTTAATTAGPAMTASCSPPPRTATTRSATCARASGPTSRSRSRAAR